MLGWFANRTYRSLRVLRFTGKQVVPQNNSMVALGITSRIQKSHPILPRQFKQSSHNIRLA